MAGKKSLGKGHYAQLPTIYTVLDTNDWDEHTIEHKTEHRIIKIKVREFTPVSNDRSTPFHKLTENDIGTALFRMREHIDPMSSSRINAQYKTRIWFNMQNTFLSDVEESLREHVDFMNRGKKTGRKKYGKDVRFEIEDMVTRRDGVKYHWTQAEKGEASNAEIVLVLYKVGNRLVSNMTKEEQVALVGESWEKQTCDLGESKPEARPPITGLCCTTSGIPVKKRR